MCFSSLSQNKALACLDCSVRARLQPQLWQMCPLWWSINVELTHSSPLTSDPRRTATEEKVESHHAPTNTQVLFEMTVGVLQMENIYLHVPMAVKKCDSHFLPFVQFEYCNECFSTLFNNSGLAEDSSVWNRSCNRQTQQREYASKHILLLYEGYYSYININSMGNSSSLDFKLPNRFVLDKSVY